MKIWIRGNDYDLEPEELDDLRRQLDQDFLDVAAVAKRLGVSREFVYDHAEELGGEKFGGTRWRFDPAALTSDCQKPEPEVQAPRRRQKPRSPESTTPLLEVRGPKP